VEYRFKTKPYQHQLDCFERNKDKKFYAYLMEMGTGKSKVLLDTAAYMYDRGWINGLLIFANKGSYMNWATSEIPTHLPDHVPRDVVIWRSPMNKKDQEHLDRALREPFAGLRIFLMNIEALSYTKGPAVAAEFARAYQCLCVADESSTVKHHNSGRTKALLKMRELFRARRIMTGSVVDNSPMDAFSQFEFLHKECLGFTSFYSYRAHFAELIDQCRMGPRPFKMIVGFRNLDDLHKRIAQHSFIIKKSECLDLPPKIYQTFQVEMTPEQTKLYEDLKKKSMAEIEGQICSVKLVLTKLMRLHQLVCGHMKDDGGCCHEVPNNRIQALLDVLGEAQGQVIIWANYREDIKAIERKLKEVYGEESTLSYFGDTGEEERSVAQYAFRAGNNPRGVRYLVGNPATGGYGITLTGANTVIYFSNSFDAEKRNQSEDRCHRIGCVDKVLYIDLVSPNTVDEKILQALQKKKGLADTITVSNWKELFA
jgi:SNF2 family DNA or RNA helicase